MYVWYLLYRLVHFLISIFLKKNYRKQEANILENEKQVIKLICKKSIDLFSNQRETSKRDQLRGFFYTIHLIP